MTRAPRLDDSIDSRLTNQVAAALIRTRHQVRGHIVDTEIKRTDAEVLAGAPAGERATARLQAQAAIRVLVRRLGVDL